MIPVLRRQSRCLAALLSCISALVTLHGCGDSDDANVTPSSCPSQPPDEGEACAGDTECTYDLPAPCGTEARCDGSQWAVDIIGVCTQPA